MRALLAGWFSFPWMGATAGDLLAAEVVGRWLDEAGCPYDMALASTLGSGVDAFAVDPDDYTHLVFICGPLGQGEPATTLFERFAHARLIGVDLSMLAPLEQWNPFDLLLERDSSRTARPDVAFLAHVACVPLIALVLVHEQKEYPEGRHREVHEAIRSALAGMDVAVVPVDTCLDPANLTGLRTPAQILSVLARADVVVTTRLHGLVLGLRAGVPVVAVDPVAGGAKVHRQAQVLGWDAVLLPEHADPAAITRLVRRCLEPAARTAAAACADRARAALAPVREELLAELRRSG